MNTIKLAYREEYDCIRVYSDCGTYTEVIDIPREQLLQFLLDTEIENEGFGIFMAHIDGEPDEPTEMTFLSPPFESEEDPNQMTMDLFAECDES